jgi:hypothetical protein
MKAKLCLVEKKDESAVVVFIGGAAARTAARHWSLAVF